jgi:hypothetical protein
MSTIRKKEQPGVETTVSASVKTQIYLIAPSKDEYDELCEQADQEHVAVFTPPKNGINISQRPQDSEMMIDLREDGEVSNGFVTAPSSD